MNGDNYKSSSVLIEADAIHLVFSNDGIKGDKDGKCKKRTEMIMNSLAC